MLYFCRFSNYIDRIPVTWLDFNGGVTGISPPSEIVDERGIYRGDPRFEIFSKKIRIVFLGAEIIIFCFSRLVLQTVAEVMSMLDVSGTHLGMPTSANSFGTTCWSLKAWTLTLRLVDFLPLPSSAGTRACQHQNAGSILISSTVPWTTVLRNTHYHLTNFALYLNMYILVHN